MVSKQCKSKFCPPLIASVLYSYYRLTIYDIVSFSCNAKVSGPASRQLLVHFQFSKRLL